MPSENKTGTLTRTVPEVGEIFCLPGPTQPIRTMIRSLALGESQLQPVETKSRRTASKVLEKALGVDLYRPTAKEKELVASELVALTSPFLTFRNCGN